MKNDKEIEQRIAELFHAHPWEGVVSIEQAIAGAIAYRRNLDAEDRLLYDEAICEGIYPSRIMELVEQSSGRDPLRSQRPKPAMKVS